jgi:hypothetical protein
MLVSISACVRACARFHVCVCVHASVCVRACLRACACACVRARFVYARMCVREHVRARACVCVCARGQLMYTVRFFCCGRRFAHNCGSVVRMCRKKALIRKKVAHYSRFCNPHESSFSDSRLEQIHCLFS